MMTVITRSGTRYDVEHLEGKVFHSSQYGSCAFVGERRERLVREALYNRRRFVKTKSANGKPAIGFTDSAATLEPGPPKKGMRILSFHLDKDGKVRWERFSTPIVSIVYHVSAGV